MAIAPAPADLRSTLDHFWSLPLEEQRAAVAKASPTLRALLLEDGRRRALDHSPGSMARLLTAGKELQAPHLELIDEAFRRIVDGVTKRLRIHVPPRHGKTRRVSRWGPLWYLRRFPDRRIILVSHEASYAATHGRWVRDMAAAFPEAGVTINPASSAANRFDVLHREGGMITTGIGGSVIGRGGDLVIIDDPIKGRKQADSVKARANLWEYWQGTLRNRLEPDAAVLAVFTRWHVDDLAGRWEEHERAGIELGWPEDEWDAWEVINLPAMAEEGDVLGRAPGEALWPDRYPERALIRIRHDLTDESGERDWLSQYQQRPTAPEGNMFKRSGVRRWYRDIDRDEREVYVLVEGAPDDEEHPELRVLVSDCARFITADLAISERETADWTVFAVWAYTGSGKAVHNGKLILLDLMRKRLQGPDQLPALRLLMERHQVGYAGIEGHQYQATLVQAARRDGLNAKKLDADGDKVTRAQPAAGKWNGGDVYIPRNESWIPEWIEELVEFPNGVHDDQVDVAAYAALEAQDIRPAVTVAPWSVPRPGGSPWNA